MANNKVKFKLGDLVAVKGLLNLRVIPLIFKGQVDAVNSSGIGYKHATDKQIIAYLDLKLKSDIFENFGDDKEKHRAIIDNYYNDLRERYDY